MGRSKRYIYNMMGMGRKARRYQQAPTSLRINDINDINDK
jgi:hypothetical protein